MLQRGIEQFAKLGCRWRYGRLLSAYLDHELNARAQAVIAGHLRECAHCRAEFEQLRFANRALLEFEIPPPARGPLSGGLMFQPPALQKVSPAKRLYSQKVAVPLPLAAGVVIALIGATLFAISGSQRTPLQVSAAVPAPSAAAITLVEVPVERVVTRIVYSRRFGSRRIRGTRKENEFTLSPPDLKGNIAQNAGRTVEWSDRTLKEFRPASSANLVW